MLSFVEPFIFVECIIYISPLDIKEYLGYTNYGPWFHIEMVPLTSSMLLANCLNLSVKWGLC